jgi:FAD/FMN-containing dehydrogenase
VTPAGIVQTRRLPGSGAGPAPDRLVLGSEGTLGVITEAWLRLQAVPRFRASASVQFDDYFGAVACVRHLAQSGLNPSNCRLLDPLEATFSGVGDGRSAILVLAFESADHPLQPWMARALELVRDHGGRYDAAAVERSMSAEGTHEHRSGAAGAWREAFLRNFKQAKVARSLDEILADPEVKLVTAAAVPNLRAEIGFRVMEAGKDYEVRGARSDLGVGGMLLKGEEIGRAHV